MKNQDKDKFEQWWIYLKWNIFICVVGMLQKSLKWKRKKLTESKLLAGDELDAAAVLP